MEIKSILIRDQQIESYSAGNGITFTNTETGKDINVKLPTVTLTKSSYNALSEEEKQADIMYVIIDDTEQPTYVVNAPIGAVMVWPGTEDTIPQGWSVCNGENGTLDLRGKIILGASETHEVGETGGSETVTLTEAQIPQHNHKFSQNQNSPNINSGGPIAVQTVSGSTGSYGSMSYVGDSQPHPNMPPYYTALWIQKTGVTPSDYATEERVQEIVEDAIGDINAILDAINGEVV